ncbi:hypothetical protein LTR37_003162 [Vermiconidia calcicola]|uniref:Uncharacterized protein n=1 Tax=Vermiconidia calcicola TaxID=1690605 RepID=A0ACC3NQA4_9PEZI|nr:hypothetical protein LTR37_003162 [Vermiconidia calcicola]
MSLRRTIGNVLALFLSAFWLFPSQAHLTNKLTPDLADKIAATTATTHKAFEPTGLDADQVQTIFGILGILTSVLLTGLLGRTRRLGFLLAILITVAGRVYPMLTIKGAEGSQWPMLAGMIGLEGLGWMLLS